MKPGPKPRPLTERVWEKIQVGATNECWPWIGTTNGRYPTIGDGYRGRTHVYAHRFVLEEHLMRPLGAGMEARHTCDNTMCCNPFHLVEGTRGDNWDDAIKRGRTNRNEKHWNWKGGISKNYKRGSNRKGANSEGSVPFRPMVE